jgi:alkyldihydroxyacetonephosphate synthase
VVDLARELAGVLPGLRTSSDEADRVAYARDLWPRHHLAVRAGEPAGHRPATIVWPSSTEEVARLVRWASGRGVPLVPFGAGSGVCAGIAPREDVVVVDLKRLSRIRRLDPEAPCVEVEAGAMGVPFEQALGRAGFTLGHFPSSILCSTVGGWVAARSAGQCSGAYGKIEDMVSALECVTGQGEVVLLKRRTSRPDLVPLVIGSEGTLAVVTSAELRLHPSPAGRTFGAWSFPTTEEGWGAMRALFQAGLRPAVARLYDPFDAMLARHAGAKKSTPEGKRGGDALARARTFSGAALRAVLRRPGALNELLRSRLATRALGGALLVVIFEGSEEGTRHGLDQARALCESAGGVQEGEAPARRWLAHRYAVSYRQAPVFADGAFVDTMEVAARWSQLGELYEGVRRALGEHVFVMAHFSHAYPDGCCIYFSFVGSADPGLVRQLGWDAACAVTYDRAWRAALAAAVEAGGTLAHHHGVGRSKAPRLRAELGHGIEVVRSLMHAFDPAGILNPGNLLPSPSSAASEVVAPASPRDTFTALPLHLDRESLLARIDTRTDLALAESELRGSGLTLDITDLDITGQSSSASPAPPAPSMALGAWLAGGAPGARDRWLDPADQLLAGLDATLADGRSLVVRPAPRRAVGPDLTALFVGAGDRFGRIESAWMRVHRRDVTRPTAPAFEHDRDPPLSDGEQSLLDAIARSLAGGPG